MSAPWWRSAVVYQIYPRSFADADGDGIGDLRGATGRLEYIRDLGADAVWLSPFYRSPMADYGYDVADHTDVDPLFGTLADADALIARAHELGLRVLFDFVANHSSDRHEWFAASRSARNSPKRAWYYWRDGDGDQPPNGWQSSFGDHAPAWTLDPSTGQWYLHSFLPEQPDLNWDEPAVEAAMHEVMRFWLRRGVDGFRIDATHRLGKDPDLRENERGRRHDQDWPSIHPRLARVRGVLEEFDGDRMAVGEVCIYDQRRLAAYVAGGDELHLAHNFVFLGQPWSATRFREVVDEFEELVDAGGWPAWCLSNHDNSRTATRYGVARARVAAMLVLTLRGTPFLYQGEELGLTDGWVPSGAVVDVAGRDPERVPMPWEPPSEADPGAGFTSGHPWLPVHPDAESLAASRQAGDPASTLSFYRALIALRRREPALHAGAYRSVDAAPDVFAYLREHDGRRLLVALNFAPFPRPLPELATGARTLLATGAHGTPFLQPDEGRILALA